MADLNPPQLDPIAMAWNTMASYSSYEEPQAAVDRRSDERFRVENSISSAPACAWWSG